MKNKNTAAIIAFFAGGFGAHKFYLGQTGIGILYLVFFWTAIPFFIAFIEFILLLMMDDKDFDTKYNGGKSSTNLGTGTADELEKLHALKVKGIITESEFQARKNKLL